MAFIYLFFAPKKQSDGVSAADQQVIVDKHNELRRKVAKGEETQGKPGPQPSATNMREMSWDADLAQAAQVLADRCVFEHDTAIPAGKCRLNLDFALAL